MDWLHILNFAAIAIVIEVSPGPNFALICKTVTWSGLDSAMANIAGFAAAFMVHGTLSVFGFSVLLLQFPFVFSAVKLLGAGYLLYLGMQTLAGGSRRVIASPPTVLQAANTNSVDIELTGLPVLQRGATQRTMQTGFRDGFITNCMNPKISLFYLAILPQYLNNNTSTGIYSYLFVMIHVLINATWFLVVALMIERLLQSEGSERVVRYMSTSSGVALLGFAAWFAMSTISDVM